LQTSHNINEIVAFLKLTIYINPTYYSISTPQREKLNKMFGKVSDDSFTHIFDLSLDSEDSRLGFHQNSSGSYANNHKMTGNGSGNNGGHVHIHSSNSSSPMSSRRDFSSSPSTPSSSSSLPLEAAFSQFAASFSSLLADKESAASAAINLDKKISELERLRNKINNSSSDNGSCHSSASSTTSSSSSSNTSSSAASQQQQSKVNTSRYKTELCRPFSEHGTCKYGDKCQFAHGQAELRSVTRHPKYKTDLCRTYHSVGFCPYGPRCHFVHNLDEVTNEPSNNQGPPQAQKQQQQQQSPSSFSTSTNKTIGSGRIISANKMPEEQQQQQQQQQQQKIKPLPMFDTVRNNNNQQLQNNRGNLFGTQNPTGWNPLNSSNIFNNVEQDQKPRLPVFSTLSK